MGFDDLVIPPLRPLDDFFPGGSARFGSPNFNDLDRLNNRVISNLFYYQSNYFAMFLTLLGMITFQYPSSVMTGSILITAFVVCIQRYTSNKHEFQQLKKKYPGGTVGLVGISAFIFCYLINSITMFLFGLLLPVLLIILHSVFRLRNLKNKVSNNLEKIGAKCTPMGVLLQELGHDNEILN